MSLQGSQQGRIVWQICDATIVLFLVLHCYNCTVLSTRLLLQNLLFVAPLVAPLIDTHQTQRACLNKMLVRSMISNLDNVRLGRNLEVCSQKKTAIIFRQ